MSHIAEAVLPDQLALPTHFDRTTTVRRLGDDRAPHGQFAFAAELDPSWSSLRGVHGGYLTALAVRAAQAVAPGREVRTVATSFLRPAQVGPAEIWVEVTRSGRSFTTVLTSLRQDGRAVNSTRISMLTPVAGHDWTTPVLDRPAPIRQCVLFTPPPGIRHFEQAELLIDPATVPLGEADDVRVAGHVRPREARPFDAAWLTAIGDWFPPSPFRRFAPPIGGVSIDYNVHVHRTLPASTDLWLEGVFEARTSVGGIALEHGTLCTPDGLPVAETFHTRWTA